MTLFFSTPFSFLMLLSYVFLLLIHFSFDSLELLWVLIELLTFVFMGLVFISTSSSPLSYSAVVYFITQSILSIVLLVGFFILRSDNSSFLSLITFVLVLMANIGAFPFSGWYQSCVSSFPTVLLILALTYHKVPLLYITVVFFSTFSGELYNYAVCFFYSLLLLNLIFLGTVSVSSSDIRTLVLTTSLANNTWIILSVVAGLNIILLYVLLYSVLLFFSFSSISSISMLSLVAVSGLPPFPIFFLNLQIIYSFILSWNSFYGFIYAILVMSFTVMVSFSYFRYVFSRSMIADFLI